MTSTRLPLIHGAAIPRIGLGTWPFVGKQCESIVDQALGLGYRLIDTSHKYGNEEAVGRAIRSSSVSREELFVTSKFNKEDHSQHGVRRAYEESLRRTGLDYLDLFLIHWPVPWQDRYVEAWEGLVQLLQSGEIAAIGVSNFKTSHLERIIAATEHVPDVNQIQMSVDLPRTEPRKFHAAQGILTEGWSPLGRGTPLLQDDRVLKIADELGRTPGQILLRWHIEQRAVPVPRASTIEKLQQNLNILDFELAPDHLTVLDSMAKGEDAARDSDSPENGH
ncbi:oxidoreductase [Paenarthrobacter ureafaciens]|uniref:aldo/keto reductase n=1 Tax=Paenarthrobacter TaxID=1742992 RepID=UPI0015C05BE4|nr:MULTISPECIES: aldo/keto reductase [Paenarthrobacter]NWL26732.1 oxidoreductase [Paenarthrobacter ureafaciens]NWL31999.1 oxidoreductase [Paenarthrobacter nitroguajacolicus]